MTVPLPDVVAETMRLDIRAAITQCDLPRLTDIAFEAGLAGYGAAYEEMAHEELAAAPHDTQTWWGLPCNCTGHLN